MKTKIEFEIPNGNMDKLIKIFERTCRICGKTTVDIYKMEIMDTCGCKVEDYICKQCLCPILTKEEKEKLFK